MAKTTTVGSTPAITFFHVPRSTTNSTTANPWDALAVRAQSGDAQALDRLLRETIKRMQMVAGKEVARCRAVGCFDVDDVVQEVLLLVWQRDLPRFHAARGNFFGFIYARVAWRVRDMLRAERSHLSLQDAPVDLLHASEQEPEAQLQKRDRDTQLQRLYLVVNDVLDSIDDTRVRDAVRETELHGKSLTLAAKDAGVHVSNISRARQKGLQLLRREIPMRLPALAA